MAYLFATLFAWSTAPLPLLAQSAGSRNRQAFAENSGDILFWIVVIVAIAIGLAIVAMLLRKWLSPEEESDAAAGFTLHDLRQMHKDGELTDAQYETARKAMLAQSMSAMSVSDTDEDEPSDPLVASGRAISGSDSLADDQPDNADPNNASPPDSSPDDGQDEEDGPERSEDPPPNGDSGPDKKPGDGSDTPPGG